MATDPTPLARALGRVPTGLYIVSTKDSDGTPMGFLGSFLVQVGFEPPTLCVAIAQGRDHLDAIRATKSFGVSILDDASKGLMAGFFRPPPEGETPFDGIETSAAPSGSTVLSGALAWLDCEYTGEHDAGDHVVVFGRVTEGQMLREGEPATHVRKNGLSY